MILSFYRAQTRASIGLFWKKAINFVESRSAPNAKFSQNMSNIRELKEKKM